MTDPADVAGGVDLTRANAARAYDYMLGGGHNFAVDRDLVARLLAVNPEVADLCRANRACLGRMVRWCAEQGIDQFLDLGSGVPTVGNVHEVALALNADARVAYVDVEPVAVAHAQEIVRDHPQVRAVRADLRDADSVLDAPEVDGLLDFSRPVAILALAVLHFVPGDLTAILAPYRAVMTSGSVLAISHGSTDQDDPDFAARLEATRRGYDDSATPGTARTRRDLHAALDGLEIVEPGLVDVTDWPRPNPSTAPLGFYAAVARVP